MKGWLIYNRADAKRNVAFINWFLEESNRLSIDLQLTYTDELQVTLQNGQVYLQTKENAIPDFAIVRTIDPMLTAQLEQAGVACFNNAETSSLTNDKIKTHMELAKLDIPMVDMYFQINTPIPKPPLAFPFVWKSAHGRGGKDVHLVETETQYQELQKLYTDHPIVMQKLAPTSGKDVRVFVIGKKVIAAVLRSSTQDFRANYSLGGNATLYSLNTEELKLVQRIIDYYHFDFVGIDFLFDENGCLLFNEIEDVVGSRTLSSVSDINIVKLYLEYINQFLEGYDCKL